MKRFKTNWLLVAIVLITSVTAGAWIRWRPAARFQFQEPKVNELRVLTWNVGYFTAAHDKNARDIELLPIAQTIKEIMPDVAILQELGNLEQAKKIIQKLGKDWNEYSVLTGHGSQVLSIITSLTIHDIEEYEFGGRKVLAGAVSNKSNDQIYLVAIHSPHPARGLEATISNIRGSISLALKSTNNVRIVAGDMNYNFDLKRKENVLYNEIMQEFGDGTSTLGETYLSHTRIDHVFHYPKEMEIIENSSGLLDLSFRFGKVPGFRDHRPVVVSYNLHNASN